MNNMVKVPTVYLAGGMRSGWQKAFIAFYNRKQPGSAIFLDPCDHGVATRKGMAQREVEEAYTAWDLSAVDQADILLGFLEKDLPGGAGLALEFGWAGAKGKTLILIEEEGFAFSKYMGMARAISDGTATVSAENRDQAFEKMTSMLAVVISRFKEKFHGNQ